MKDNSNAANSSQNCPTIPHLPSSSLGANPSTDNGVRRDGPGIRMSSSAGHRSTVLPPAPRLALPWIAALLTMVFWASSFVVIRDAADHYTPGPMSLLRMGAAGIVLSALMLFRKPKFPSSKLTWVIMVIWGVAWFAGYTVVLNAAERSIDAGTAAMIVNIGPLLVAVFAGLFLGEGLPWRLVVGMMVSLAGVGMITIASFTGVLTIGGMLLSLTAAILYAACVVLQKRFLSHDDSVTVTWTGILAGAIACLVFTPGLVTEVAHAPMGITLQVIYLGVVPTALAFNLWGYAIKHLPAGVLSSSGLLVPAIVVVLAWLILAEVPPLLAAIGGVFCLLGAAFAIVPQMLRSSRPQ